MISRTMRTLSSMLTVPSFGCFTVDPQVKHMAELMMRAQRRSFLNKAVLNQNKTVLYARVRQNADSVLRLRDEGLCPGIIKRHHSTNKPELDIVLPGNVIRQMMRKGSYPLETVYLRVDGQQYRTVFKSGSLHFERFIQQSVFDEYVPGEDNHLKIPLEMTHLGQNPYFQKGSQFEFKVEKIDVICYNSDYPSRFYVDVSYANPQRPYRIADLVNLFPPGLLIHPSVDTNTKVFTILPVEKLKQFQEQMRLQSYMESIKKKDKVIPPGQQGQTTGAAAATGGAAAERSGGKK